MTPGRAMGTVVVDPDALQARAELYRCLARAFMAPCDEAMFVAMRDELAGDLAELAAELGLDADAALAEFGAAMQRIAEPLALLQVYSALFLVPPVAAHLNAGVYLDGAIDGGSVRQMEQAYAACGVERDESFRDLADHLAVQLEFVSWLYDNLAWRQRDPAAGAPLSVEPGHFLHAYARQWLPPFVDDLTQAGDQVEANPYLPLARLLQRAVDADAIAVPIDPRVARKARAITSARAKYAARCISEQDLETIRRKLMAHGLSADHVVLRR